MNMNFSLHGHYAKTAEIYCARCIFPKQASLKHWLRGGGMFRRIFEVRALQKQVALRRLRLVNGEYVTVEQVRHEIPKSPVKVYNFEVQDKHTYYVGVIICFLDG